MGFQYSKKMLRKNHKTIGVIFIHKNFIFDSAFFSELGNSIEYRLKEYGYRLNAYHIHEHSDISLELQQILKDDPDGLILFGTLMTDSEIRYFNQLTLPVLLLDAYFPSFLQVIVLLSIMSMVHVPQLNILLTTAKDVLDTSALLRRFQTYENALTDFIKPFEMLAIILVKQSFMK